MRKKKAAGRNDSFGKLVRDLRLEKKMTGAELCRKSGRLDPRTLTALEKGRIKNPTLETVKSVAAGFGLSMSELLRRSEEKSSRVFYAGTQKGFFQMDFPSMGIRVVSFTPVTPDFFCGKFIFGSRRRIEESLLPPDLPVFVSVLVGRFEVWAAKSAIVLKEGDNLYLKGGSGPVFQNLLERESVLQVVTAPSFLGLRPGQGLPILTRKR